MCEMWSVSARGNASSYTFAPPMTYMFLLCLLAILMASCKDRAGVVPGKVFVLLITMLRRPGRGRFVLVS